MSGSNEELVDSLLSQAAGQHALMLARLPEEIARTLPVDAQGITRAIDHLAEALDFDAEQRRALFRGHAMNPAVLHARVFGGEGLTDSTVVAAYVEGARVRAEALALLADTAGGEGLGATVRRLLSDHPPPAEGEEVTGGLRDVYAAHEQAALLIARHLDAPV
ncbi:MAG: hypothetical protein J2O48_05155 [Solirubrobacterales bacterium]|nr:hypothetical protein [Solirubrobacterales bacterium]